MDVFEKEAASQISEARAMRHPPTFLSPARLIAALALYTLLALIPQPFELPLLIRLIAQPAPVRVAVPVDGVAMRDLHGSWGGARSGGRRHECIDIFAPRGTRVLAATEGVVWRRGTDPLGGLVVWVLGPAAQMHYYAHLDRYSERRVGDRVDVGDTLGYVGTSGNAKGGAPHLHYGIYPRGSGAIDPYPLLTGKR